MIPLSIPHLSGNELKYVTECIETGWVSSAGAYVTKFEEMVAEWAHGKYGIATSSGTTGLHLALHLLGINKGDKVIVPNITFIASANAVKYTGAEPVFVDVDPETWQMDLDLLERAIQRETSLKAIMPVHVLGNMCDMEKLMEIAHKYNIPVIEDATEALGSYFKGKPAGSFGILNVFSFNGNKIITTGGGGVIISNNETLAKRAKHLSTQSKVNPDTYYHDEIGFNYRLVNILAAIGVAQMEQLPLFIKRKKSIDSFYRNELQNVGDIQFQKIEENVDPNCWLFTFKSRKQKDILLKLSQNNIIARPFWFPMNQLPMFTKNLYVTTNDHSKEIHELCVSIPSSVNLKLDEMEKVVKVIKSIF